MKFYTNQNILLRENMKVGTIVKKIPNTEKYLASYYDEFNKFKYIVIAEMNVIDDTEYEVIKNRINSINKIINS